MTGGGKKELLIVDHHQDLAGGGEIALLRLLPRFDRDKYGLTVACVPGGTLAEQIEAMGIRMVPLHVNPRLTSTNIIQETSNLDAVRYIFTSAGEFLKIVARIRKRLQSANISLVYTNSLKSCVLSSVAALGTKAAVVHHMHDICDPGKFNLPMLLTFKWAARRGVRAIVAISKAVADSLVNIGVDPQKIYTVHNGINLDDYPIIPMQEAKKRLGLDPDAPVIGHVARLMRWKGQGFFLRAASQVKADARFLVVGGLFWEEPDYEKELHRIVEDRGLQDRVTFLGHRADIPLVMCAMDVLAHTSTKPEPFGLAIIEAMASEKPVVAFDNGGIPEIVEAGKTGLLTRPLDEEQFARALDELLSEPEKARAMGKAGRARVEKLFSLDTQCEKIQACFADILGEKKQ